MVRSSQCATSLSLPSLNRNAIPINRMESRIADTFTDGLARLTGDEQKAVMTTAFDLQLIAANPRMQFHKLDKAREKNF
jgi:hypothetical protein